MTGTDRLRAALGPDIEFVGEAAGRFGLSLGIGANCRATPMDERGSVGVAAGLALAGRRVVVELIDPNGLSRAAETLGELTSIASRSEGAFRIALVVLAPLGPRPEGVAALVVGDADELPGALPAALDAGVPVILQIAPAALDGREEGAAPLPIGVARVRRPGGRVTLLAEGAGVALALAQEEGEVIDLRGGLDRSAIATSIRRTGRVVLVHDGGSRALDVALHEGFLHLESPPAAVLAAAGSDALARALSDSITY